MFNDANFRYQLHELFFDRKLQWFNEIPGFGYLEFESG